MVENSTKTKEVNYESLPSEMTKEEKVEVTFEDKIKSCISQLEKNPEDKTIANILNYSKNLRNL
ncbi:hypothetical protein ACFRAE_03160 [Sphingobacterium sp. HJSM2_6]|uniref:hypothetical protein n=1 Tax=Sphingobacterium sp. HJSM2_6 TaxID=3366264 RepID=UPI003BCBD2B2